MTNNMKVPTSKRKRKSKKSKKKSSKNKTKTKKSEQSRSARNNVILLETVLERAPCESGRRVAEMMNGRLNWKYSDMVIVENYVEQNEANTSA